MMVSFKWIYSVLGREIVSATMNTQIAGKDNFVKFCLSIRYIIVYWFQDRALKLLSPKVASDNNGTIIAILES